MTDGGLARLRDFVRDIGQLVEAGADEPDIIAKGGAMLRRLVATDDWLPDMFAEPSFERYQQYLLYCDLRERFSIVSFVWGPGQSTPVHDHTVWGLIGVLRGAEICRSFGEDKPGELSLRQECRFAPGEVTAVSPRIGDIHQVANALGDRPSISIHVYGANIGALARHLFEPPSARAKPFVSGYANTVLPNLWDRSAETRARLAT